MLELWGFLVIFVICPILGGLPLIAWITFALAKKQLARFGIVNMSIAGAFYHGGTPVGMLALLSEAFKGIVAVLLARACFPDASAWEIIALITLTVGRYWFAKSTATINVIWGFAVHDPLATAFLLLMATVSFTIIRSRQFAKIGILVVFPVIVAILHIDDGLRIFAAIALAVILAWIDQQHPDGGEVFSLETPEDSPVPATFFRGYQDLLSLDDDLEAVFVGDKAAKLSEIKRWGYPVPKGWLILPYDDPQKLIDFLQPSELSPLVVRSSAIGEDSEIASAPGLYDSTLNVTTKQGLQNAIARTQASHNKPSAVQYRSDTYGRKQRNLKTSGMAVLVQQQVNSVYSGVAFSRDPITQEVDAVVVEAVVGNPTQVVSGRVTPEQYRAFVVQTDNTSFVHLEGKGKVPAPIIKQVAYLARHLEEHYYGIPQDIEWSYDGQTLWVLQARPITTLLPIWTRKIAAQAIPGILCPLNWSINRPLVSAAWGGIFAVAMGERSIGLDFNEAITLHFSRTYLNATLLGQIFHRIGLPLESLEFLTTNSKINIPIVDTIASNLPGFLRLIGRELSLRQDFRRERRRRFIIGLSQLAQESAEDLDPPGLLVRIEYTLDLLSRATYYSVLAPLSAAFRQKIFKVKDSEINNRLAPEIVAMTALQELATEAKKILPVFDPDNLFEDLNVSEEGQRILSELTQITRRYGYLSENSDIATPTWQEKPEAAREMFVQLMLGSEPSTPKRSPRRGWVQNRVDLNGLVTETYLQLQAELRWCFLALEKQWLDSGILQQAGDIFFLEFTEIEKLITTPDNITISRLQVIVWQRRSLLARDRNLNTAPLLVYGDAPPIIPALMPALEPDQVMQGTTASPGQAEGRIKVLRNLQELPEIEPDTILVIPYTDSGWTDLLIRAQGVIAETGGRLSQSCILAREYKIPMIVDVSNATWVLQDGQRVKLDASRGIVEISNDLRPE
ncbi:glycerol-3-phosphate acyltransferase [Calothrix sp. PCC 6303]|uniref:glycerol-3-phosphate acyltransferase n=1 Tax=Calothrix sp. PCC 6303 TaxID=1170562 RepID=UPI0002A02015|nr:glycerol-3-phosphate acyltransferase [Calothrix sp. PCC 6303]AFZ00208.1 pyruvate phosphate dikinase PEP/pyruvate-binding protein [Calothrix sp. PCC 6303]